ncbi:hypothetical protein CONLIGDRAFT_678651 [Coniochaeta ligniaria NRRL 30616]|uniref:Uncharacterized protein n=1 Tax=Coniochaeta ligniaria NRRL 30616 TaxID=1408157 RepID=A0A1J7IY77_9PEZI|nr:hypothetical protein CONLIGDRAFT_678651 [Coniochaeta ligniaria NRRL 30616]
MARRHSLQNRPTSPGPPSSVHEPVLSRKDETREDARTTSGRKRSSSVAGFFTKFLPSHRPERSGTLRDQGFWEQQRTDNPKPEQRLDLRHRHGSDSIVSDGWNPAIPLLKETQPTQGYRPEGQPLLRVESQPIGNRPKSQVPHRQKPGERGRQQDGQPVNVTKETRTKAEVVASTVPRQPSDPGSPTENTIKRLVTTFDAKREARRQRRSLKESSDFLGVQGINPHTGVMDVLTPTSSSPTDRTLMSAPEPKGHSESMADFRNAYQRAARSRDAEEASLERLRKEQERLDKIQRRKESIRTFQQRVRWRKDRNQWSSVAEPDLSPIADASTRSRTPRSTSDGAIVPPPAIQRVLRWEEQRSMSTPAALQAGPSTPQSRPDIVTQESSDTVIHTPHPASDRRYSVMTDIFGNGAKRSSPAAPRRASEPGPSVEIASPGSSNSNRRIYRKPVPPPKDKQKPPPLKITIPDSVEQSTVPDPTTHQGPFLGSRIETGGASYQNIRDKAIKSPSTPMEIGQDENLRLGGPQNMDKTPIGSPPDVAVRDFASERNRKVWFVNHPASPGNSPKKSSSPDQSRCINAAPATSSQSQQRTLHFYRGPLIPLRLGPSQQDTRVMRSSEVETKPVDIIDIEVPSKPTDAQTSGWAQELMEDLASFGQDTKDSPLTTEHGTQSASPTGAVETRQGSSAKEITTKESPKSAYIPTTTITGYDPRLLVHTRGLRRRSLFDGPAEGSGCKDDRVIRISAMEAATKLQLERARENPGSRDSRAAQVSTTELIDTEVTSEAEVKTDLPPQKRKTSSTSVRQPTQPNFDLLASPPRLSPSVWPSLDIPAPHQRPHRMPVRAEYQQERRTSGPRTEIVPYGPEPGPANGTMSSYQYLPTNDYHNGAGLSVPQKTALIYAQEPGPMIPTTSAPQLAATRERCERLYRRVSRFHPKGPHREAAMTPAVGPVLAERYTNANGTRDKLTPTPGPHGRNTNMVPYKLPPTTASLTYTSTYQASVPKYRYMPSLSPSSSASSSSRSEQSTPQSELNGYQDDHQNQKRSQVPVREPAMEAARTALVGTHYNAATTRIVHVVSRKRNGKGQMTGTTASTAAAWGPDGQKGSGSGEALPDGSAGTDGPSGNTMTDKIARVRRIALKDPHAGAATRQKDKSAEISGLAVKGMLVYWSLIAPVFDAGSPISRRFSARRSTWHDCVVYLLALVFVLFAFLAAVWGIKGMLLVAGLGRTVVRACMVLVGV